MITKRFRFVSPGEVTVGVVRGAGNGSVANINCLRLEQSLAVAGRALHIYEPKPGHVAVYSEYNDERPGQADLIDLRNPELKILEMNDSDVVFRIEP